MRKIEVDEEFLFDLSTSLQLMTNYADDGSLDRNDDSYKIFFDDVDRAREILTQLNTLLLDEVENTIKYFQARLDSDREIDQDNENQEEEEDESEGS